MKRSILFFKGILGERSCSQCLKLCRIIYRGNTINKVDSLNRIVDSIIINLQNKVSNVERDFGIFYYMIMWVFARKNAADKPAAFFY